MGKIALLVSREEMLHQAHNILQENKYPITEMRVVRSDNAVVEARQVIANGANIIIARGLQALMIKQYTDTPVIEIVLTAQEMGLLVTRAKQIIKKEHPVIAVVGFQNMFCDMSYFDELYDIELRTYYASQGDELKSLVCQARDAGASLVIGGDTVITTATEEGMPSLFLSTTEDSLKMAFSMAEAMDYAMGVEKKSAAQLDTLLDYSFNGVIRLDCGGVITAVNPLMEDLLGKKEADIRGRQIGEVLPQIDEEIRNQVLLEGKEYSMLLELNRVSVFTVLAPVLYETMVDGAILTCHKITRQTREVSGNEKKKKQRGLPALTQFEDILQKSDAMQECIRLAKLYALSEQPVVIMGEAGTEKRMIAQGIHNNSIRGRGPFLDVPCDGLSEEEQKATIFGDHGAAVQAALGTLLIQDADSLTAANQYRLYQLIRFHECHGQDIGQLRKLDVRIIVTLRVPMEQLLREGRMRPDLYYLLSGLELRIPSLRERPEDLKEKLETSVRGCCEHYVRYHVLTEGAKQELLHYPWKGNLFQIDSFCERLILTADRRSIDEIRIRQLLRELYGEETRRSLSQSGGPGEQIPAYANREAARVAEALKRNAGSRDRTAAELKISKTTLWRLMKKYEIMDIK